MGELGWRGRMFVSGIWCDFICLALLVYCNTLMFLFVGYIAYGSNEHMKAFNSQELKSKTQAASRASIARCQAIPNLSIICPAPTLWFYIFSTARIFIYQNTK